MNGNDDEALTFQPYLAINEYYGLATALLAGTGIGELPQSCSLNSCVTDASSKSCLIGTCQYSISGCPISETATSHARCGCLRNSPLNDLNALSGPTYLTGITSFKDRSYPCPHCSKHRKYICILPLYSSLWGWGYVVT